CMLNSAPDRLTMPPSKLTPLLLLTNRLPAPVQFTVPALVSTPSRVLSPAPPRSNTAVLATIKVLPLLSCPTPVQFQIPCTTTLPPRLSFTKLTLELVTVRLPFCVNVPLASERFDTLKLP